MRGVIKIKKYFSTLDNIVRLNARELGNGWAAKANDKRRKKGKSKFLIIHKNLDEFVTFRHLPGIKNKVTTAEMVMDELKGEKLKSVLIR